MTFHIKAEQQKFTWRESGGHPVADVEKWGNGLWAVCCPLCGHIHNINAAVKIDSTGTTYKPNCAIAKTVHRHMYHQWQDKHTKAAQFDAVTLILRQPNVIPLDSPATPATKAA